MRRAFLSGLTLVLAMTTSTAAQSVTSLRGLGYPMMATDSRSEALGGLGIGLIGLAVPFTNPASAAGVGRRGVVIAATATERTSALGTVSATSGATRFPLMRILVPLGNAVLTAGYGSYLDQSWAVVRDGSQPLGTGTVTYTDYLSSMGGVGQAQLGAALPLGERFAVGLTLGRYMGRQELVLRRRFDSTSVGTLRSYQETRSVQYGGASARLGVRWDLGSAARVGASVTWSGSLSADSMAGAVTSQEYDLPLQVAAGASAYLSPGILAAVSGRWSGWSATDAGSGLVDTGEPVSSRDTWELGAGVEFDNPQRRESSSFPLRLGFQYRQLPFTFVSDQPTEWFVSAGAGVRIGSDFDTPLARLDVTILRGARSAAGGGGVPALEETLWRFALGLSIFGT